MARKRQERGIGAERTPRLPPVFPAEITGRDRDGEKRSLELFAREVMPAFAGKAR